MIHQVKYFLFDLLTDAQKVFVNASGSPYAPTLPKDSEGYKLFQTILNQIKKNGYKKDTSPEKQAERDKFTKKFTDESKKN